MSSNDKPKTSLDKFEEFFSTTYKDDVFEVLEKYPDEKSLVIDYNNLEMFDPDLADLLIDKPEEVITASQKAVKNIDPLMKDAVLNIRFKNLTNVIPLSDLLSKYIGKFVAADGIVRKTDEIRPRIEVGMFECRGCARQWEQEQPATGNIVSPSLCPECGGRSFKPLLDDSKYIDTQSARMQEPLENLSGGTEPKQMLLVLEDDLVDCLNPGDKVRITGTLKTFREERTGRFKNYLYVNHIEHLVQEFEELKLSEEDEEKIIELSKDPHIHDKIINSTAPSIRGYREVKEAIALQLFGGAVKELEDGTRLRGDIHILIVGDPGIGKSQILKYVSKLAPRSVYTSGKGTSGAGLTAAAVRDELGGWSLEAGALVLGDQGNVCVDELDKMRSEDRSALHEALEQQTVSIAKAGIMATLNTRCAVLAAANPKFGRFDRYKAIAEQIDLPAPILSRFDLTFVIEDKPNIENDRKLAQHILKIHQNNTVNYEIPVPITARQLEAIIRLAEASAKLQLKDKVEAEDAHRAIRLQQTCLRQVGYDPDTDTIDIDRVEGRTPKSDRDKINKIVEVIVNLQEEYNGNAPMETLKNIMVDEYDMSEEKVESSVRQLKSKGIIYEPTNGYLRRVD